MKLKKMMLHDEHEVMNASEMKQIVGGQVIGSSTYGMNNGKCSGGCLSLIHISEPTRP